MYGEEMRKRWEERSERQGKKTIYFGYFPFCLFLLARTFIELVGRTLKGILEDGVEFVEKNLARLRNVKRDMRKGREKGYGKGREKSVRILFFFSVFLFSYLIPTNL